MAPRFALLAIVSLVSASSAGGAKPSMDPTAVAAAIKRAGRFFVENCNHHGGYVWRYSRDLELSEGEAETTPDQIWVQPPGTPAIGLVLLEAYEATRDPYFLDAAKRAAQALVRGQRHSGGWYYSVEFDPEKRKAIGYRENSEYLAKKGKDFNNKTTLDDDTTTGTLRFLMRLDAILKGSDTAIRDAIDYGLRALVAAQRPNGGWRQNWDHLPEPTTEKELPILQASFPPEWPRIWPNNWTGQYYLNDNVHGRALSVVLEAAEKYGKPEYAEAARRAGDFLIRAQLPEPQPAWAQQYDERMHPVWDRKFEPPAVSGAESQDAIAALLLIYRKTGDKRYLAPIPRALAYLRTSALPNGKLARFYELQTNKPLYFKVTGKRYDLTYSDAEVPSHYAFVVESKLDRLSAEYELVRNGGQEAKMPPANEPDPGDIRDVIAAMDDRGAWISARGMRGHRKASQEGVIQSETFIKNMKTLCRYLNRRTGE